MFLIWREGLLNIFFNLDNLFGLFFVCIRLFICLFESVWILKFGRLVVLKVNFLLYFIFFLSFNIFINFFCILLFCFGKGLKNLFFLGMNMLYFKSVWMLLFVGLILMKIVLFFCIVVLICLYCRILFLVYYVFLVLGRYVNMFKFCKVNMVIF